MIEAPGKSGFPQDTPNIVRECLCAQGAVLPNEGMPVPGSIAERLYLARKQLEQRLRRDVTKKEVGATLGVHAVTYADWERGRYEPSLEQIARLADLYGVHPSWLAFGLGRMDDPLETGPAEFTDLSAADYTAMSDPDEQPAKQTRRKRANGG